MDVRFLDLRDATSIAACPETLLLLDEPAGRMCDATATEAFIDELELAYTSGKRVVLALIPSEWRELQRHRPRLFDDKDVTFLEPISEGGALKLARDDREREIVRRIRPEWRRSPFLVDVLLDLCEERGCDDPAECESTASDHCLSRTGSYASALVDKGLDKVELAILRHAQTQRPIPQACQSATEWLERCGAVCRRNGRIELADPILCARFPPPFRIHHVSDVHFGPNQARLTDNKAVATDLAGRAIAEAVDRGTRADAYVEHLQHLKENGGSPNLLVVSGDLAERADEKEFSQAVDWLKNAQSFVTVHEHATADSPSVLVVPGNHDVDWQAAARGEPRHNRFASIFDAYPRPKLESKAAERSLAHIRFGEVGIEFILLGSSELGGEPDADARLKMLKDELATARSAIEPKDNGKLAALDPGLIHADELRRIQRAKFMCPVRVAVVHHPVSSLPGTEVGRYTGLVNSGDLKQALYQHRFSFILHGHLHMAKLVEERWPIDGHIPCHIVSAPSLSHTVTATTNGFVEITISSERHSRGETFRAEVQFYEAAGAGWKRGDAYVIDPLLTAGDRC